MAIITITISDVGTDGKSCRIHCESDPPMPESAMDATFAQQVAVVALGSVVESVEGTDCKVIPGHAPELNPEGSN